MNLNLESGQAYASYVLIFVIGFILGVLCAKAGVFV